MTGSNSQLLKIDILLVTMSMFKFNIRMRLTDARDYTYLYSNSSAFTVIGGICAVSDRMHTGIVLFQKRRNVCTRIYDLEQRIVICWRFALVRALVY